MAAFKFLFLYIFVMKKLLTLAVLAASFALVGCVNTNPTEEVVMEPVAEEAVETPVEEVVVEEVAVEEVVAEEVAPVAEEVVAE